MLRWYFFITVFLTYVLINDLSLNYIKVEIVKKSLKTANIKKCAVIFNVAIFASSAIVYYIKYNFLSYLLDTGRVILISSK